VNTVVARVGHDIPDRPPLRLGVGEEVRVGERDDRWPAFVFVTAADGRGWVPSRHLSAPGEVAKVVTAYDTTELATTAGETLEVLAEDRPSGWLWCRSQAGREGWVPIDTLDEAPD
jgi:hypothetical protein